MLICKCIPNVCTISSILIVDYASRITSFQNNDIPGRDFCTLSSLMRVSRILQLFSPLSFNATILRRIYCGILDNLSMPSILVHVYMYLATKSTMTEIATV